MPHLLKDKRIAITGAAGSVGQALIEAILPQQPAVVRLLDSDESRLFDLEQRYGGRDDLRFLLGDVRSRARMERAFQDVDVVFHAAALKHVKMGEYNPGEVVETNVHGTQAVLDAAIATGVKHVVNASSDKAANPSNVMGTTKLLAERLVTAANYTKGSAATRSWSVRFGNILGSRGSVVPIFQSQIRAGGPLTITDPRMSRFVITEKRAVDLLLRSLEVAQGGEVFIMKMDAIRVLDLAHVMIEELAPRYGHDAKTIALREIGLKPGEKMYEEIMTREEGERAYELGELYVIPPMMRELLHEPPREGTPVGSALSSENATWLTRGQIRDMLLRNRLLEA